MAEKTKEEIAAEKVVKDELAKTEAATAAVKEEKENADNLVKNANEAADRIEAANAKTEELMTRQAATKAEKILGGTTEAGTPSQTDEEKAAAAAKEQIKGSGFEDMLDPPAEKKKE